MTSLRALSVSLVLAALLLPSIVHAQAYPTKPVRVVIAFPPGGSNDVVGRIVFQKMSEVTRRSFVIENRGGAAGTIAAEHVARSPADGYTVMVQSATHLANAHLYKSLPYDTLKDFIGVTTLARQVGILVAHPSMPVKSVKEFLALAKVRPGQITYGSGGNGSSYHLQMALLESMTNIKLVHVPYRGAGPAWNAFLSGETDSMFATISGFVPHYKSGRVRALGVSSEKRTTQFPEIPAIAEFVPGYEFTAWVGCFVPAGTPKAIVDALNAALGRVLSDPGVASKLIAQTLDPMYTTPEQFAARLKLDYEKYAHVIKISGARIE
ncbi:MAG: tripartite tricarboxylate transporter substrate binding protein [Betaproteobacteria bacterium]|nr:tripartite tricarboxylate transporter substrate binding protein [Betaproteobacteria bacterium]